MELSLLTDTNTHLHVNNVFVNFQDILIWADSIACDLSQQFDMNTKVLSNICHLGTREQALFHQGRIFKLSKNFDLLNEVYFYIKEYLLC